MAGDLRRASAANALPPAAADYLNSIEARVPRPVRLALHPG